MLDNNFVILGAAIKVYGIVGYLSDTLRGRTQPNRTMWFMWALAPGIAFAAEVNQHAGRQALLTFTAGLCALLVFVATFLNRKAYWKLTKIDWLCGGMSIVAIVFWQITSDGNIGLGFSILADGIAAIPTAVKAFKSPQSESANAFLLATIAAAITLMTIKDWTFANYGFPIYSLLTCLSLYLLIELPHFKLARALNK